MQRRSMLLAAIGSLAASHAGAGADAAVGEVLDRPVRMSPLADQRLITGIARAGERLVAVGQRGHIVHSEDGGRVWVQALVPVSSDLTAVSFVDAKVGYATGHDGVVLGTRDGGHDWTRLIEGRQVNRLVLEHMQRRVAASDAGEQDKKLLAEALRNAEAGPDKPFLDLCFTSVSEGFVVGAYGLILRTADGGKTWEPWFDRTDNPGLLNLYAIRAHLGSIYIAGEGGLLLKLDRDMQRFRELTSPYKGSYFGLAATNAGVLAYGMRGNAFLSVDDGASWEPAKTGLTASIIGNAVGADGMLALVDQGGAIAVSGDGGRNFATPSLRSPMPLAAVAFSSKTELVVGGLRGLRIVELISKDK
ncbi:YCF48-related protein [Variovorax sp. J31P179]|uniref:WD40/YVTN/BNR-like repeat-containing protein n=1 Tax=Variovorax sp. J31P179 TaxID=3053508 RepID=UPI002576EDA1|nr:YCF48-related protein [Variovorax sp. J31P179]MDM0082890.1 YCF48-related protein [Variovorax sp. J31P179]